MTSKTLRRKRLFLVPPRRGCKPVSSTLMGRRVSAIWALVFLNGETLAHPETQKGDTGIFEFHSRRAARAG